VVSAFSAINGATAMQSDRPKAGQKLLFGEGLVGSDRIGRPESGDRW
jgi:hypothetical protein